MEKHKKLSLLEKYNIYKEYLIQREFGISKRSFCEERDILFSDMSNFMARKDLWIKNKAKYMRYLELSNEYDLQKSKTGKFIVSEFIKKNADETIDKKTFKFFREHKCITEKLYSSGIPLEDIFSEYYFKTDILKMRFNKVEIEEKENTLFEPHYESKAKKEDIELIINGLKITFTDEINSEKLLKIIKFLREL